MNATSNDSTKTWVYGKVEPGWYVARCVWDESYARNLESLGYLVERSQENPGIKKEVA